MRYATICYKRKGIMNIGDDIQLAAVKNIYRYMGITDWEGVLEIEFHNLTDYDGEEVILPICFPFYGYNNQLESTCFSPKITPVFLSISMLDTDLCNREVEYLKAYEPVGCRDAYTAAGLCEKGIDAYLNGCMTITLPKVKAAKRVNASKVYCVDVYPEVMDCMPVEIREHCITTSHLIEDQITDTLAYTEEIFNTYAARAKLVVTSRLHCAVPCIAMGIPVVFVHHTYSYRFTWLEDIITVYTPDRYGEINWNPDVPKLEKHKQVLLENAAARIQAKTADYGSWKIIERDTILAVSGLYTKRKPRDCVIDSMVFTTAWLKRKWMPDTTVKYAVWGVAPTAKLLISHLRKYYPQAELSGVIDTYKQGQFMGLAIERIEDRKDAGELFIFVTADAVNNTAKRYFNKIGKAQDTYCMCWREPGLSVNEEDG